MTTFTVCSHNIPPSLDLDGSLEAFAAAVDVGDVVALQEATHLRDAFTGGPFDAYWDDHDSRSNLPILWRKATFDLIGQGSDRVYPAGTRMEPGAGPDVATAEWFNWVVLQHTSGQVVSVINVHPVPTIAGNPVRTALHAVVVTRVALFGFETLHRYLGPKSPVLAMGDWNCEPDKPNMAVLRTLPWHCDTLGTPTAGSRSIDDVYRLGTAIQPVRQWTFITSSDHKGAAVEYEVRS